MAANEAPDTGTLSHTELTITHMSYIDDLFDTLMQLQQNKRLPPLHLWQPERSGEIDIRIDREGRWYHEGTRIERQPLVDLFATILRLEANGYYLVTPVEKMKILVEEVPFIAVDLDVRGSGEDKQLLFSTNVGDYIIAGKEHPIHMRAERPFILVRDGLEARIQRSVFYRLVDEGEAQGNDLVVYSDGQGFNLGSLVA
jgi:hypothetical protein